MSGPFFGGKFFGGSFFKAIVEIFDTHDGVKDEDFRKKRETLRLQLSGAFADIEAAPRELPKLEIFAKRLPKRERPVYLEKVAKIRNLEAELAEIERIMRNQDEEVFLLLLA